MDTAVQSPVAPSIGRARTLARRFFGYDRLRDFQEQVVEHILDGEDTLAVIPTGGGKTLCYALPALLRPGVVLVVSPLIALIRDQVLRLRKDGIPAAALDSMQSPSERQQVLSALKNKQVKVLFVSPERMALPSFRSFIDECNIQLVAIDEAHCISQWGYNFRPEYRKLGEYIADLTDVTKLALTATAPHNVREDIIKALHIDQHNLVMQSPIRDNLKLGRVKTSKSQPMNTSVLRSIQHTEGNGIVYCNTRKQVDEIYLLLKKWETSTVRYHAGLSGDQRYKAHQAFTSGAAKVVVATNAFGLGVNKDDLRFVHHAGMPKCLEQYLQEIGRAGRDGKAAECTLFFQAKDYHVQKFLIDMSAPETKLMKEGFRLLQNLYKNHPAIYHEGSKLLGSRLDLNESKTEFLLSALEREGFIQIIREFDTPQKIAPGLVTDLVERNKIWKSYSERRDSSLQRLGTMYEVASSETPIESFIEDYFG